MDPATYALESPSKDAIELFQQDGLFVLHQVLDPDVIASTGRQVARAFDQLDQRRAELDESDRRLLDRLEMPVPQQGDQFRLRVENYRVLDSEPLREAIRECGRGDFLWHYPPMLRRQTPGVSGAALPYHQDCAYTRHYPHFLVCWTPLTPCGIDAPGLELVAGEHGAELDHHRSELWEYGVDETTASAFAQRGVAPKLLPGDVILFTSRTPHRTYLTDAMKRSRITIDFRAVAICDLDAKTRAKRRFVDPVHFELR